VNLEPLQPVYDCPGPFLSVYLDRTRSTEDAARMLQTRWQQLRDDAVSQGAAAADVAAVEEALTGDDTAEHVPGPHGRGLVSCGGELLVEEVLDAPPARDVVRWGPLPDLLPLLIGTAGRVPHAVVLVDRIGADITVHAPHSDTFVEVEGGDYPIRKVKPGGWSQRRYQDRAENLWEQNAKRVAERLDSLVRRHRPAVIAVAGDVRARGLLRDAVMETTAALFVELGEGGRADDGSGESLHKAVKEVVAERRAEQDRRVLDRYREEAGQHDRAAEGLEATVTALREARVATLLLRPDVDQATVWAGPEPVHLALSEDDVRGMGAAEAFQVPASLGVIRAAAATSAEARVVGDEPALRDGIGAILRYG